MEPPRRLRFAAELAVELDKRRAVVVDEDFQRNAEFAAVAQDALMVTGDPGGAGVEVDVPIRLPLDMLRGVGFRDLVAASYRPDPTAGPRPCLEDRALIAGLAETIRCRQAGYSGAKDRDALAVPGFNTGGAAYAVGTASNPAMFKAE